MARDALLALAAQGVCRFPAAPRAQAPRGLGPLAELPGCTRCPLSQGRRRVIFEVANPKPVFFLADFVQQQDEDGPLFQGEAPSQVLGRLIERLGIGGRVHRSFALKCASRAAPPTPREFAACGVYLEEELRVVEPEAIVVFGLRAADSLARAAGVPYLLEGQVEILGKRRQVLLCPSVTELHQIPSWRSAVWRELQVLRTLS